MELLGETYWTFFFKCETNKKIRILQITAASKLIMLYFQFMPVDNQRLDPILLKLMQKAM